MKIIRCSNAPKYEPEKDWKRTSLCCEKDISVEHFVKPPYHSSPRHEHPNTQVLMVLKGSMIITTDVEQHELNEGDVAYIPGGEPHVVTNPLDVPSVGVDIFVPGRTFDFWLKQRRETK